MLRQWPSVYAFNSLSGPFMLDSFFFSSPRRRLVLQTKISRNSIFFLISFQFQSLLLAVGPVCRLFLIRLYPAVQLLVYRKADLDGSPSLVTLAKKSEKHSVVVSSLSASYKRTCEIGQLA